MTFGPMICDHHITAFLISRFGDAAAKSLYPSAKSIWRTPTARIRRSSRRIDRSKKSDHRHRLLRPRRERPCRRAAERNNKFSPPDVDCHATLPRAHATEKTITHPVVLRCGILNRLMSAQGLGSVKTIFEVVWRNINVSKRPETHVKFS